METNKVKGHIRLIDEGPDVSRPAEALDLGSGLLELLSTPDYNSEAETCEFCPGRVVRGEKRQGSSGESLLAVRA
jgi:hypothetical protein